jgi:hypothetical protein
MEIKGTIKRTSKSNYLRTSQPRNNLWRKILHSDYYNLRTFQKDIGLHIEGYRPIYI